MIRDRAASRGGERPRSRSGLRVPRAGRRHARAPAGGGGGEPAPRRARAAYGPSHVALRRDVLQVFRLEEVPRPELATTALQPGRAVARWAGLVSYRKYSDLKQVSISVITPVYLATLRIDCRPNYSVFVLDLWNKTRDMHRRHAISPGFSGHHQDLSLCLACLGATMVS